MICARWIVAVLLVELAIYGAAWLWELLYPWMLVGKYGWW